MNETEESTPLYEQIYAIVRQIPPGKVATYGQIANPTPMHANPALRVDHPLPGDVVPCIPQG